MRACSTELFERHALSGLVDGALSTLIPARYAWEAVEAGRIGTRHVAILALDALAQAARLERARCCRCCAWRRRPPTATAPSGTCTSNFQRAPNFLDVFPSDARLATAAANGEKEFAETARVLPPLLAPVPPWKELSPEAIAHLDDRFR